MLLGLSILMIIALLILKILLFDGIYKLQKSHDLINLKMIEIKHLTTFRKLFLKILERFLN